VLISVGVAQHPLGSPTHTRRKDRMSYAHEEFVIDLTQVTSTMSPNAPVRFLFLCWVEDADARMNSHKFFMN
jgi:hypothetical protein